MIEHTSLCLSNGDPSENSIPVETSNLVGSQIKIGLVVHCVGNLDFKFPYFTQLLLMTAVEGMFVKKIAMFV